MRMTRSRIRGTVRAGCAALAACAALAGSASATPANRAALEDRYGEFLSRSLNRCSTCHLPSDIEDPQSLEEFPHNAFGDRLRAIGEAAGRPDPLSRRLEIIAAEDSDGDGAPNEAEILLGSAPGDAARAPDSAALESVAGVAARFAEASEANRWEPFVAVERPPVPDPRSRRHWVRNPIDAFAAAEHERLGLTPRPEADRRTLMRRVYLDLIGLPPTPGEQAAYLSDTAPGAYDRLVDRLLDDPRYGERWGRHWMDIWRYSDWAGWSGGNQIRDSQPHIWRWRDWIVESLNRDAGYDRMVTEMLAGDEIAPEDPDTLRATGFLVRNYKMLSREKWLQDTVKHTAQAFLGLTMDCARCHDHMYDPVTQEEYYRLRAVFESHMVRTDHVPGQLDTAKDGLVRAYDAELEAVTHFYIRGNQEEPDKDRAIAPGVPAALCGGGASLAPETVSLPRFAAVPAARPFVVQETLAAAENRADDARAREAETAGSETASADDIRAAELDRAAAEAAVAALKATLHVEALDAGDITGDRHAAAAAAAAAQRAETIAAAAVAEHAAATELKKTTAAAEEAGDDEAKRNAAAAKRDEAEKKHTEAKKALDEAMAAEETPVTADDFKPREIPRYPERSTGRRLAFAQWVVDDANPLAARVAVNHIWLRHFGRGIVATPENFGREGAKPSHPRLLDWLAAEFMEAGWKMKPLHRLILTSATYRSASTPDADSAAIDPDNKFLWRFAPRRIEAELVRDCVLAAAGSLDATRRGTPVPCTDGLTSRRRSLYLQIAPEKDVPFLTVFDGPNPVECYQRQPTVMPQQALALSNSQLVLREAAAAAESIAADHPADADFIRAAFERILCRPPSADELAHCRAFLIDAAGDPAERRRNLALVLFNHHEFVTIQ